MLILSIVMAVSDALTMLFSRCSLGIAPFMIMFCASVLRIVKIVTAYLAVLDLICLLPSGDNLLKKWYKVCVIPAAFTIILVIINVFSGILFYVDRHNEFYVYAWSYFELVYISKAIYVLAAVVLLWKINKKMIIPFAMVFATAIFIDLLYFDISTSAIEFTIMLVYLLVENMNRSFHKEELCL